MSSKIGLLFVICLTTAVSLKFTTAAPAAHLEDVFHNKQFIEKFTEFLHDDKKAAAALSEFMQNDEEIVREKRDASDAVDLDEFSNDQNEQQKPGFFDRAAKFVVELLQRFLRWVNTDSN